MTDTLLRSLRDHMLDESEPLAGLLRKCLLLGAETGSDSLRQWARNELNGYDEADKLPSYRKVATPPITADTMSGNTWASNMTYSVFQLPPKAREVISDELSLHQPIEELEKLSAQESLPFVSPGLAYAQQVWNQSLGSFQQVVSMRFTMSASMISGVLGQIRTQLVDLVADLTARTPLSELPRKDLVDAAVGTHIGTQYNTTVQTSHGPLAIGTSATATSNGLSVEDAIALLDSVRGASSEVRDQATKEELLAAVEDLQSELSGSAPDTGAVVKKAGRLRSLAASIGSATLSAATSGAVDAVTTLAMSGMFG